MGNTLDAFKAQQAAAEALHAKLIEVSSLFSTLQPKLDGLKVDQRLKETFEAETTWLTKVQELVREVRQFREVEFRRFRLGVVWRWAMACLFALAAVGVHEAVRIHGENPYASEIERLRAQAQLLDRVERRISTMTPVERQQFDRLMGIESRPGPSDNDARRATKKHHDSGAALTQSEPRDRR
jgi:hypothetical protein